MSNTKFSSVFVPGLSRDALGATCAAIAASGKGIVRWRRKGASDGSGKDRNAGQFDSRPVVKAWIDATGKRVNYLFIVLDGDAGKGDGFRMIRIDSLIEVGALPPEGRRCSCCQEAEADIGPLTQHSTGEVLCEDCRGEACADEDYARYSDD